MAIADRPSAMAFATSTEYTSARVKRWQRIVLVAAWVVAIFVVLVISNRHPRSASDPTATYLTRDVEDSRTAVADARLATGARRPFRDDSPDEPRGDRRQRGRSAAVGPTEAHLVWEFATRGAITAQAVVGPDGTVYVGSHDGSFYAVRPDGSLRWARALGDRIYATAALARDGTVYVGSDADRFFALDSAGAVRWSLATDGDADTGARVLSNGDVVFAAGRDVYRVHPDGRVAWRLRTREKVFTTPAIDDDGTIYVGGQDDHVYAIRGDGRVLWAHRTGDDNDGAPLLSDDGLVIVGSDDRFVRAIDRAGRERWRTSVGGYVRAAMALSTEGLLLVPVMGPDAKLVALDAATGERRWSVAVGRSQSSEVGIASAPTVDASGHVYFGAHDDFLYCADARGQLRWFTSVGTDIDAAPTLAPDGTLYVGADDGVLRAFRDGAPRR